MRPLRQWATLTLLAVLVATTAHASTYTVNSTGDADDDNPGDNVCATAGSVCTLRAAMTEADAHSGADTIAFGIAGGGAQTITAATALPRISDEVHIDCATQGGAVCCSGLNCASAAWTVIIDRGGGTAGGLYLDGINSTVNGCEVINVGGSDANAYAIRLTAASTVATCNNVHGSWGGIIASGSGATIGGVGSDDANWSHDNEFGLSALGDDTVIRGNVTGTSADGLSAAPNNAQGIYVEGGDAVLVDGNLSSGNTGVGIFVKVDATNAVVSNNIVGRNRTDAADLCNALPQIQDQGTDTTLSGNTVGACTPLGCCNVSGGPITCFDYSAGLQPASLADCQSALDGALGKVCSGDGTTPCTGDSDCTGNGTCVGVATASGFNPDAACDGGLGGSCPPLAGPTDTPADTATVTATATSTPTHTGTATATGTITHTPTITPTPGPAAPLQRTPLVLRRLELHPLNLNQQRLVR